MKTLQITIILFILVCFTFYCTAQNNQAPSQAPQKPKQKKMLLQDGDLGSQSNPVKCHKARGQKTYLKKLRGPNGQSLKFWRTGHAGPDAKGHYLDKFRIITNDKSRQVDIYMDMYYSKKESDTMSIKGFTLAPAKTSPDPKPSPKPSKPGISIPPAQPAHQPLTKTTATTGNIQGTSSTPSPSDTSNTLTNSSTCSTPAPAVATRGKNQSTSNDYIPGFDDGPISPPSPAPSPPTPPQDKKPKKKQPQASPLPTVTSKATPTPGNPGDRIPGFDDIPLSSPVPATQPPNPTGNKQYLSLVPVPENPGLSITPPKNNPVDGLANLLYQLATREVQDFQAKRPHLMVNQTGHTIHKSKLKIKALTAVLAGIKGKHSTKGGKIISQVMKPRGIDYILVLLYETPNNGNIVIRPYLVSKPDGKIYSRHLIFSQDEIICTNPSTAEIELCPQAGTNIGLAIRTALDHSIK